MLLPEVGWFIFRVSDEPLGFDGALHQTLLNFLSLDGTVCFADMGKAKLTPVGSSSTEGEAVEFAGIVLTGTLLHPFQRAKTRSHQIRESGFELFFFLQDFVTFKSCRFVCFGFKRSDTTPNTPAFI